MDPVPRDSEKAALLVQTSVVDSSPSQEYLNSSRSFRQRASQFRHGVWLGVLETAFVCMSLYAIVKQGGLIDGAQAWLKHPSIVPQEPIDAFGYTIHVREPRTPRSSVPTSSNQTRMVCTFLTNFSLLTLLSRTFYLCTSPTRVHQA